MIEAYYYPPYYPPRPKRKLGLIVILILVIALVVAIPLLIVATRKPAPAPTAPTPPPGEQPAQPPTAPPQPQWNLIAESESRRRKWGFVDTWRIEVYAIPPVSAERINQRGWQTLIVEYSRQRVKVVLPSGRVYWTHLQPDDIRIRVTQTVSELETYEVAKATAWKFWIELYVYIITPAKADRIYYKMFTYRVKKTPAEWTWTLSLQEIPGIQEYDLENAVLVVIVTVNIDMIEPKWIWWAPAALVLTVGATPETVKCI